MPQPVGSTANKTEESQQLEKAIENNQKKKKGKDREGRGEEGKQRNGRGKKKEKRRKGGRKSYPVAFNEIEAEDFLLQRRIEDPLFPELLFIRT